MQISAYPEKIRPWTESLAEESLCSASSAHSNPKGGAPVTQDSLANQGLQADLLVRREGGFFRVLYCKTSSAPQQARMVRCDVLCVLLFGAVREAQASSAVTAW